jgi:hypothetical protein
VSDFWSLGEIRKPDMRAFKKRLSYKTKLVKRKVKNNKTLNNISFPEFPGDTVLAGTHVIYSRFILLFRLKKQNFFSDTMIISYSSEYRDIMKNDQNNIIYTISRLNPQRIENIYIREIIDSNTNKTEDYHLVKRREKKLRKLLLGEGVARHKIVLVTRAI